MNNELTKEVKEKIIGMGADLAGVADVERLRGQPKGYSAWDYLPTVKSVIVFAIHFPYSIISAWEESPFAYQYYGYARINAEIGRISFYTAKFLESKGYQSYPVVPTVFMKHCDYEKLMGEFDHRHAAFVAGLGEFGYSNNFLTPQYGSSQRFGSILTSAELLSDSMYEGEPLCDRCLKCVKICPTSALKEKSRIHNVFGKKIEYAELDKVACFYSILGLPPGSGGFLNIKPPKKEKFTSKDIRWGIIKAMLKNPVQYFYQMIQQHSIDWVDYCGRCLQVCSRPKNRLNAPE